MNYWKKGILSVVLALVLVATNCGLGSMRSTYAEAESCFITVGDKTITETMKIAEVKELFGEPKLVTSSYWGGNAYTFYGENYSDYLYLETYADGSIASYGSISEGFKTDKINYGDETDTYNRVGMEAEEDGILYGVICYTEEREDAMEIFGQNPVENNRSICKHAVEMWNAISYLYGADTPTTYQEDLFCISAQLADNGSNWEEYCRNTYQESNYQTCLYSVNGFRKWNCPNPLAFAQNARDCVCKEGYAQAFLYHIDSDGYKGISMGFVNPAVIKEWNTVPYTEEEQELLEKVREEYNHSVETFNAQTSYYDVEPDFSSLPLTGGKLSESAAKGAVGYLNSIRIGAGLKPLEYSEELSEAAQCKSTYTVYLSEQGISGNDPHNPVQLEGISDEYYAKCQAGSGENLFMCGIMSTNVIGSLTYALDDSYGTGQYYLRGHRYNLLDPNYRYIGVGNTLQQGCHKMSGYQSSDVEVVAWPSKGIMPVESGFVPNGIMTCRFYNGYRGTSNTDVTIRCLNDNTTWTIEQENLSKGQDMYVSGNLVSYGDSSLSFGVGGVYEITFSNLINEENETVSYSYRTIYEKAYTALSEGSWPQTLELDCTQVTMKPGAVKRVKAVIAPETALNKRIHWESANSAVAIVNECGEITAISCGATQVVARTEAGTVTAICKVVVSDAEEPDNDIPDDNDPDNDIPDDNDPDNDIPDDNDPDDDTPDDNDPDDDAPGDDKPDTKWLAGDVDGNDKVDLSDAQMVLKAALKITQLPEDKKTVADVDEDGKISLADAQIILKIALKIIRL